MDEALVKVMSLMPGLVTDVLPKETDNATVFLLKKANTVKENSSSEEVKEALHSIEAVLNSTWEQLNTGHWSEVPIHRRQVYTAASLIKIFLLLVKQKQTQIDAIEVVQKTVGVADIGLMLGAPLTPGSSGWNLSDVVVVLSTMLMDTHGPEKYVFPSMSISTSETIEFPDSVKGHQIPALECPSLEHFQRNHFSAYLPVKLTGCIDHWPAMKLWSDPTYLLKRAGARVVPIELGAHYVDPAWSQSLMTLREFITSFITQPSDSSKMGYLAQHPLFDQISELRADIREPEYCCLRDNNDDQEEPVIDINAWFGPKGTVSPLHFDPKHNLLAQVVGEKRVLLYAPGDSVHLYPHTGKTLSNTAQVNPEHPDYTMFPEFKNATAFECHLKSGEMLYIPPACWHHVRALTTSFSVSFWWN